MSGYFVHGGTQYPYGQSAPSNTQNDLSYQQQAQTSQYYQNSAYANQTPRTNLSATKPTGTNFYGNSSYNSQPLAQGYSTAQRTYSSNSQSGTSNSAYNRPSSTNNFGRIGSYGNNYGTSSFGSTAKQEQKFGANYSGFKSGSIGGTDMSNPMGSTSSSYFTQQSQQPSYSTSYPSNTTYKPPVIEEPPTTQYSYEKALYVAANQYYMNKKSEASGGNRGAATGRGRGSRGRGRGGATSTFGTHVGPKIIKATEVKAYLYAWCGQRRLKPEYTIEPIGNPPKMKFRCQLHISGRDYVAKVEALSKKDAQSKAAWDFCEHLVKTGFMKQSELPPKPLDPAPRNNPPKPSTPAGTEPESAESPEESGGWSLENCRQRLNQFTQRWRIPAEFKHETMGPEHARTFVAELSFRVKWLNKDFVAKEKGTNKKQATAVCALAMVRQLYKEGLIEKHGDPIKHPRRPKHENEGDKAKKSQETPITAAGTKRKATESTPMEDVDEYGNWTLEESRQRLHQFCQVTNQTLEIKYKDDGNSPPKSFTASVSIEATVDDEKRVFEKSYTSSGKKLAAQHVALEVIKELYKLSLVEPNLGIQQNKKKNAHQRALMDIPVMPFDPSFAPSYGPPTMFCGPGYGGFMGPPMQRRTPVEDAIINEKHRRIYPTDMEINLIQKSVCTIESALREVSDELAKAVVEEGSENEGSKVKTEPKEEQAKPALQQGKDGKRILQGVMRVGILAKGLLLQGDLSAHLVLMCQEIPTVSLIKKISTILSRIMEESDKKYLVELHASDCSINVISPAEMDEVKGETKKCTVKVSLTCPAMRTLKDPADGPVDMLNQDKCVGSLAELRHAKWFQACANCVPWCVVLLRIFRDMRKRIATWQPISEWALELLIEKALRTSYNTLTVGEAFRRVLSCISSGILLEDASGIFDPCEKEPTDVIGKMTLQEREDITESAHHALRMLVFRQTHKILGIEPLPSKPAKRNSSTSASGAADDDLRMEVM